MSTTDRTGSGGLTTKILAGHGAGDAEPGALAMVTCDLVMLNDVSGSLAMRAFERMGAVRVFDPEHLPAVECPGAWRDVQDGDEITIDLACGTLARPADEAVWSFPAPSPFVADLLAVGGLEEWTRKRLAAVRPD